MQAQQASPVHLCMSEVGLSLQIPKHAQHARTSLCVCKHIKQCAAIIGYSRRVSLRVAEAVTAELQIDASCNPWLKLLAA